MLLQDPHCCHPSMPVGVSAAGEMLAVVVVSVLWVSCCWERVPIALVVSATLHLLPGWN